MLYAVSYSESFSDKREEAAYQHRLGRKLLFWAMEQEYGIDAKLLSIETGEHDQPFFANHPARFSLSHCRGYVCCTLSTEKIGVDIEVLRDYDPRLARRICTAGELRALEACPRRDRALTALWTLKESRMKLSGKGISFGFQNAAFHWESDTFRSVEQEIASVTLEPFPDVFLSVCTAGELPREVKIADISRL